MALVRQTTARYLLVGIVHLYAVMVLQQKVLQRLFCVVHGGKHEVDGGPQRKDNFITMRTIIRACQ